MLHAKHINAVPTKSGSSWSAPSCSVDEENQIWAYKVQWAKETELRNKANKVLECEEKKEAEEECQMDVDSGADIRKKLDQRRKET